MNKEKYIQELDHLHINGTFKESMKENLYQETLKTHKKWNMKVVSLCVVSACLLIVFMNGQNASPQHQDMLPDIISTPSIQFDGNKPEIEVPSIFYPYISSGDGFGHAGVMVKDKAELQTHNPYDMNHSSKTMPVYYNWNRVDINGNRVHEVSEENQKAILQNYAKRLQIKDYEIKKEQFRNGYVLKSQYYELAIHYSTTLNIKFSEEYIKMNPIDMTVNTQEEADALTLRLFEMYKNLFDIKEPIVNTSYDYNIYGEKHWTFSISEKKKNQSESLITSLTNQITFSDVESEDNKLTSINIEFCDLSEKVGDYPIISVEEARNKLLKGEYESTVGQLESFEIGYVEMSYNTNQFNEYFLPYYDFYVYDGDYNEDGVHFKDYTIVRVCALDDYYINNKYLAEQYFWQ